MTLLNRTSQGILRPAVRRVISTMPAFSQVEMAAVDPMYLLKQEYDKDPSADKVDLGAGVLRDERGHCYEFPVVQRAKKLLSQRRLTHDYRPTLGIESFRQNAAQLVFRQGDPALQSNRVASIQTVAGTGACHIGAVFLRKYWQTDSQVYIGTPTWGNYVPLLQHAGFPGNSIHYYSHISPDTNDIDIASVLTTLQSAPRQSIFIFQAICHNPTGRDYSQAQWTRIADLMSEQQHFAFFDTAYQSLGQSLDNDAFAIRLFRERDINLLVAQSFSKNFGLYSERVGALHIPCASSSIAANVLDQLRALTRWEVSSAPAYGAELVNIVLADGALESQWKEELVQARHRLHDLRKAFHDQLTDRLGTPSPRNGKSSGWGHLLEENGLFSFTGLSDTQTWELIDKHRVYLPGNGRINISGLNSVNMQRVAEALDSVIRG